MEAALKAALARMFQKPRVYVCAYERKRFGRIEHVRSHTRRWPQQLYLPL